MKKLLLFLFCFAVKMSCFAQIVVDKNVAINYNRAVKQLSLDDRKFILSEEFAKTFSGLEIFTKYNIDTLNKKDKVPPRGRVVIQFIDPVTGKIEEPDTSALSKDESIYKVIPYSAILFNDTLFFQIPVFAEGAVYKIFKGRVKSTYEEYDKSDTIFRLNLTQSKTNKLSIPVKIIEFKLSTLNFKPGQVIYGEVEFTTDAYYVDDSDFTSGYIKMRIHGKSVFKAKVIEAPKE